MKILDWLESLRNPLKHTTQILIEYGDTTDLQVVANCALEAAIALISKVLGTAEFKTFENNKLVKKQMYFLWNVQPNVNQSKHQFLQKIVSDLVRLGDCLAIMERGQLYIADSYTLNNTAFAENTYSNIVLNNITVKNYAEKDVLHFTRGIKPYNLNAMLKQHIALLYRSIVSYKQSNVKRSTLTIPTNYPQTPQAQEDLQKLINEQLKDFHKSENGATLPLTNGITYQDLTNHTYKNASDSRDIRTLIDDIYDFVAISLNIPPQLLKGTIAESDNTVKNLMRLCITPLAKMIQTEINRKMYTPADLLSGTRIEIDTKYLLMDIHDLADALEKLTRIGTNTINDNLEALGREPITDKIGDERYITLNYQREKGEEDEQAEKS